MSQGARGSFFTRYFLASIVFTALFVAAGAYLSREAVLTYRKMTAQPPGQGQAQGENGGPPGMGPRGDYGGPPGWGPRGENGGPPGMGPRGDYGGPPGWGPRGENGGPPGWGPREGMGPPGWGQQRRGGPGDQKSRDFHFIIGGLVLFAIISVSVSTATLLLYFRRKAKTASQVMQDLRAGRLKSRFPIDRFDETGRIMLEFNTMADEIERLVNQLQASEAHRKQLVQDLGHDLKTPLASLRLLMDTLRETEDLEAERRRKFVDAAASEVLYVSSLVDDLLTLSLVEEAAFKAARDEVELQALAASVIEQVTAGNPSKRIELAPPGAGAPFTLTGDRALLRRLLRNTIENAASFARSRVTVAIERGADGTLRARVEDDGPGFPDSLLSTYGTRASSRSFLETSGGRVSIGLGTVISKKIVDLHSGKIEPSNRMGSQGEILGARVSFSLKSLA